MANESYGTFFSETKFPYDPLWQGPLKKHRYCTNRLWLISFSAFVLIYAIIAAYAFTNGDIQKLIVPTDSEGRKCGIDTEVQNKSYLLFFDLTECINENSCAGTAQVCQTNCPTENFLYQSNVGVLEDVKKKIICKINIDKDLITSWDDLDALIDQEKCAKWYLKSESVINRCIPKAPVPPEFQSIVSDDQLNNATQVILQLAEVESRLENIYNDIIASGYPVLGFIALSGVVAFFYIILLRWLAKPFVYISISIICAILVYLIYESSIEYSLDESSNWIYIMIFCIISLIGIVLSTIFLHRKIDLACQVIKESSRAVSCISSSLLFPIIPWILHLLVVALAAAVLAYLQTITVPNYQVQKTVAQLNVENFCNCQSQINDTCDPDMFKFECLDPNGGPCKSVGCYQTSTTTPGQVYIYHLINFLGFLWLSFFISAFGQMVLALTFATWYWTFNKRDVPTFTLIKSIRITCRYHVGTLALGSFIIWICDIIHVLLKPLSVGQNNGPLSVRAATGCIGSLIEFLMSFVQYINRNAYTMCAIHGKNFCRSAKDAFNLIMRNVVRTIVVTNITDWLLRIAKYFIIALTVALTVVYYRNKGTKDISGVEVPAAMALIGSYLLTKVIFTVHKAAVDTLFLCFLLDSERHDGSPERPYYMSIRLKQLLQK